MYLLYLDDSGSAEPGNGEYLVVGGVCIEERQVQHVTSELDRIADKLLPGQAEGVEFHASEMFSGRVEPWKSMTKDQRRGAIREVLGVLANAFEVVRAFAAVVHKATAVADGHHPMDVAFAAVCWPFDDFLHRVDGKGLVILDESTHSTRLQNLAQGFRQPGSSRNPVRHIVDGPLFVTSRAFRCVQLADHLAYSVFRRFEARDAYYFDVIANRFDTHGKVIHGLQHIEKDTDTCMCIGCLSRR